MANWYDKYLSIYERPFKEVPHQTIDLIRTQLAQQQSSDPLVSVVVIAYNEERRLAACLWSLSEMKSDYPLEIIGINNNSTDQTEQLYQTLNLPYYNEKRQSPPSMST